MCKLLFIIAFVLLGFLLANAVGCASAPTVGQVTIGRNSLAAVELGIATAAPEDKAQARPGIIITRVYLDALESSALAALHVPPTADEARDVSALQAAKALQKAADAAFDSVKKVVRLFPATRPVH